MRPTFRLCLLVAMTLLAIAGCSEDATAPDPSQSAIGMLEGEAGTADFEITVGAAGDSRRRFEGPFLLRGFNLHYVDSLEALVVDLTLSNRGEVAHAEPVGLTFVRLMPEGVTVQNPDNGINGEGAAINFAFANDDGRWTPGETSLPRTVQFGIERGRAVAFVARLDIGEPIDGGTIAGRVWNDADQDSVIDPEEAGVPGARIVLMSVGDEDTTVTDSRRYTRTDGDGNYAFHRLPAGVYTVSIPPSAIIQPVTPPEITVLLTETEGDVSDFLDANFGVRVSYVPPDPFPIGAYIEVKGEYVSDPDRVIAMRIDLARCGNNPFSPYDGDDGDDDDGDDDERDCRKGKLRGPVTAVDDENSAFAVMGTWVSIDPATVAFDVEVGQRLDVWVHRADDGSLVADVIREAGSDREYPDTEQVYGRIDDVEIGDDRSIRLQVLNTLIIVAHRPHATP